MYYPHFQMKKPSLRENLPKFIQRASVGSRDSTPGLLILDPGFYPHYHTVFACLASLWKLDSAMSSSFTTNTIHLWTKQEKGGTGNWGPL